MEIERIRQLCSGGNIKWSVHAAKSANFCGFCRKAETCGKNASIASKQKVGKQRNALRHKMHEFSAGTQLTARAIYA